MQKIKKGTSRYKKLIRKTHFVGMFRLPGSKLITPKVIIQDLEGFSFVKPKSCQYIDFFHLIDDRPKKILFK
jgi:hypothetical protein